MEETGMEERGYIHNDFTCRRRAKHVFISKHGILYFEIEIEEAGM